MIILLLNDPIFSRTSISEVSMKKFAMFTFNPSAVELAPRIFYKYYTFNWWKTMEQLLYMHIVFSKWNFFLTKGWIKLYMWTERISRLVFTGCDLSCVCVCVLNETREKLESLIYPGSLFFSFIRALLWERSSTAEW